MRRGQLLIVRLLAQGFLAVIGISAILNSHGVLYSVVMGGVFALVGVGCLMTEVLELCTQALHRWLHRVGWPTYDCEDCIGMQAHGCYCYGSDAVAPCEGPRNHHLFARWLHGTLFGGPKR